MLINGVECLGKKLNRTHMEDDFNLMEKASEPIEIKEIDKTSESLQLHEEGSISPLIIFYFSIMLFLTFVVTNIGAAYVSHRELTSRTEAALGIAAQELDEFKYYYFSPITEFLADSSIQRGELKIPIDCAQASNRFREVLANEREGRDVIIKKFECNGSELYANVEEREDLLFQLRFLNITSYINRVSVATDSTFMKN